MQDRRPRRGYCSCSFFCRTTDVEESVNSNEIGFVLTNFSLFIFFGMCLLSLARHLSMNRGRVLRGVVVGRKEGKEDEEGQDSEQWLSQEQRGRGTSGTPGPEIW